MDSHAIHIRGLSKRYRLGGMRRLDDTFGDFLAQRMRFLGRRGNDTRREPADRPRDFWALRDIDLDIPAGQVVGIIGRNGAGKSTLLKILSRITDPTAGYAELRGRVGSLLEVGTGFHPELTGRENIRLNGAILGMRAREVARRFDEIVAFSGVERFLDTPVKRYSSGMRVRLAFAVAAHLDPDILIVDEVLAVGDAEFQNKCLGKMREVSSGEGRTVLFVSHNLAAMRKLCDQAVLLDHGVIVRRGPTDEVIGAYIAGDGERGGSVTWSDESAPEAEGVRLIRAWMTDPRGVVSDAFDYRSGFTLHVEYELRRPAPGMRIGFRLRSMDGTTVCGATDYREQSDPRRLPGRYVTTCRFPGNTLNTGTYALTLGADAPPYSQSFIRVENCLAFAIEEAEGHGPTCATPPGLLRPDLHWQVDRAA